MKWKQNTDTFIHYFYMSLSLVLGLLLSLISKSWSSRSCKFEIFRVLFARFFSSWENSANHKKIRGKKYFFLLNW